MAFMLGEALGEEFVIAQQHRVSDQVVKSAGRVFQILEMFDTLHREALVSEMAALLRLPQSSTSVLLRSMVEMGYVSYNRETRAYYPTTKVALLGSWINAPLISDGPLLKLMQRINERTGQTVVLAAPNQVSAEYIHIVQATSHTRLYIAKGLRRSLTKSACGLALLADLPDAEIKRITMRINSEAPTIEDVEPMNTVMARIERARADGYVLNCEHMAPGVSMISIALPPPRLGDRFVVGLGGLSEQLADNEDLFVQIMREEIASYEEITSKGTVANSSVAVAGRFQRRRRHSGMAA